MRTCLIICLIFTFGCSSNRYFVVRHAEKTILTKDSANMKVTDPPLSEAGKVRAFGLRDELKNKNIRFIFSTNTLRATSTAEPLHQEKGIPIQIYSASSDSLNVFIDRLKAIRKGNVLIVGHSNTVDDIVNKLSGGTNLTGDLRDNEFDNLFIITRKGKKVIFTRQKYGYPSNPE